MSKFLKNHIIILLITVILSWAIYITNNVYSFQSTKQQYIEHLITYEKNNNNIIKELKELSKNIDLNYKDLNNKIDNNQNKIFDKLLDIQKQIK